MTLVPDTVPETPPKTVTEITRPAPARVSLVKGGPAVVEAPVAGPAPPWRRWADLGMRVVGFLVALALTVVTAVYEVLYSAQFWGEYRVPASVVAAVVVNVALIWFTVAVTGRRLAVVPVAVLWVAVMVVASSRRSEGDLLLTDNNWVGIVTMLVGSLTYAVAGYRLVLTAFRPRP
jgi:hypothetical protein